MANRGGYRPGAGRPPGYESTLRKTGHVTKVARIPEHWEPEDIHDGLDYLAALVDQYQQQIEEADAASKSGKAGPRYTFLREAMEQFKAAFPRTFFEGGRWKASSPAQLDEVQNAIAKKVARIKRKQKKASRLMK